MKKLRVIFHVNETARWDTALGNIVNLLKDVGEEGAEVSVLGNGPAVEVYGDAERVKVMEGLAGRGVRFLACRNSLNNLCSTAGVCISEEGLPGFVEVVPAGITELIRRQAEGFAYVKP